MVVHGQQKHRGAVLSMIGYTTAARPKLKTSLGCNAADHPGERAYVKVTRVPYSRKSDRILAANARIPTDYVFNFIKQICIVSR
jgi:hypothetical protein